MNQKNYLKEQTKGEKYGLYGIYRSTYSKYLELDEEGNIIEKSDDDE